jgi:hypothetical protein
MRIWLALIVAPLLALADQTVAFALVGPGCATQTTLGLHASHALFLALAVAATLAAWRNWQETTAVVAGDTDAVRQRHFLAGVAMTVAALSAAAIVAMWIPTWLISPCVA